MFEEKGTWISRSDFDEIDDKQSRFLISDCRENLCFLAFPLFFNSTEGKEYGSKVELPSLRPVSVPCYSCPRRRSFLHFHDTRLQKAETGAVFWNNAGTEDDKGVGRRKDSTPGERNEKERQVETGAETVAPRNEDKNRKAEYWRQQKTRGGGLGGGGRENRRERKDKSEIKREVGSEAPEGNKDSRALGQSEMERGERKERRDQREDSDEGVEANGEEGLCPSVCPSVRPSVCRSVGRLVGRSAGARVSHLHRNKLVGTIGSSVHSEHCKHGATVFPWTNRKPLQYALLTLSTRGEGPIIDPTRYPLYVVQ
ncbi:hypothetical protein X777_05298 [Ooceraea biroi]|uniref:Uncharacterized protein n=1 Tax=Ooceraea biroi TaxID=2015173 RepID=A0A026WGH3_OOCBI|nr:hypothetical protein X777_05298 [Ooceraea biroi]